jgi:hypothetical protein
LELDQNQWRFEVGHLYKTLAKARADKLKAQLVINRSTATATLLAT